MLDIIVLYLSGSYKFYFYFSFERPIFYLKISLMCVRPALSILKGEKIGLELQRPPTSTQMILSPIHSLSMWIWWVHSMTKYLVWAYKLTCHKFSDEIKDRWKVHSHSIKVGWR